MEEEMKQWKCNEMGNSSKETSKEEEEEMKERAEKAQGWRRKETKRKQNKRDELLSFKCQSTGIYERADFVRASQRIQSFFGTESHFI